MRLVDELLVPGCFAFSAPPTDPRACKREMLIGLIGLNAPCKSEDERA